MNLHSTFRWTDEKIAALLRLHAEGFSASAVCEKIGAPSREAVCGKLARLGLSGNKNSSANRSARPRALLPRKPAPRPFVAVNAVRMARRREDAPGVGALFPQFREPAGSTAVAIVDLRTGLCRWPLWGLEELSVEEKFYCGAAAGDLYCDRHAVRARA